MNGDLQSIVSELLADTIDVSAEGIDRQIARALRRIGEFAGVDRSYIFETDGTRMSNTHEWCRDGVRPEKPNLQNVPVEAYQWCMSHILQRRVLHIARVADLPDGQPDKELLRAEGIQSLLAVPIATNEKVIGLLGFDAVREEKEWTGDTVSLLTIVGSIIGNALQRTRTERMLRRE
ncbi:MAG TPA: GAF domain-containing protein, partial [Thermoanaerobaculia bacterium]|nr:GAF domain-containing protein [Thermoanaerobaculia bacterium]